MKLLAIQSETFFILVFGDTVFRKGNIVKIDLKTDAEPIRGRIINIDTNQKNAIITLDISREYHQNTIEICEENIKDIHQIFTDDEL